jgi:hypothetical protein
MTTKPPLQKILQGKLHKESKKQTIPQKCRQYQTTEEEKEESRE